MSRFNTKTHSTKPAVAFTTSPLASASTTPDTRTALGAPGWTRTPQAELFLLASGALHDGSDQYHESGHSRDARLTKLTGQLAVTDPEWVYDLAVWLRTSGNMRTASLTIAADFVRARLSAGVVSERHGFNRRIIADVCQRPDEPGELLAYWTATYGRRVPKPVKRGIADAVRRLYNGKALLKYDGDSKAYRFGDVLNLVHAAPDPDKPWQGELFRYALDRRHNPADATVPESNHTLTAHQQLMALPVEERRAVVTAPDGAERLAAAGMTWEMLAGWLQGPMDKAAWEAMIPSMGVMAQIRNLRNFDQAGVSDRAAQQIIDRLTDPQQIARSKQFPFRYLAAYQAVGSLRWGYPLEQALNHSLANVPALGGRTLILVDRSGSMWHGMSEKTSLKWADAAAIFGTALALRAEQGDLVQFGTASAPVSFRKGESVLKILERFGSLGGTDTTAAVRLHYRGQDRVVIITDEQSGSYRSGDPTEQVPANVPVYTWNLAGYRAAHGPSGKNARFALGGLTDDAFRFIPLAEAGAKGVWPWQVSQAE